MPSQGFGVPPANRNLLEYSGVKYTLVPTMTAKRAPTSTDINYPIQTIWRVGSSPTTGTYGDEYILTKIVANAATWVLLAGDSPGTVPSGGTGVATLTAHGLMVGEGVSPVASMSAGLAGQVVQSGGASADPVYSTATFPSTATSTGTVLRANGTNWVSSTSTWADTFAISTIAYASGVNALSGLATANNGVLITGATGIPAIGNTLAANFSAIISTAATPIAISAISTDNTNVASDAFFYAASGGASGGSAYSRYSNLVRYWSAGVKASDGTYRITSDTSGNSPATGTTVVNISTGGAMTRPLQPSFSAYLNSAVANVSGDGTNYTLGSGGALLTEIFDQANNFNTNGTFTSPVGGVYDLKSGAYWNGLATATIFYNQIVTSNRNYNRIFSKAAGIQDESILNQALADMDAADVATVVVSVTGEAGKTADLYGTANDVYTYFQGSLQT